MSTIFRDSKGQGLDEWSRSWQGMTCFGCGQRNADAVWLSEGTFAICYWCALRILPALLADAMRARPNAANLLIETHKKMDESFWRAAALALARQPAPIAMSDLEGIQADLDGE